MIQVTCIEKDLQSLHCSTLCKSPSPTLWVGHYKAFVLAAPKLLQEARLVSNKRTACTQSIFEFSGEALSSESVLLVCLVIDGLKMC